MLGEFLAVVTTKMRCGEAFRDKETGLGVARLLVQLALAASNSTRHLGRRPAGRCRHERRSGQPPGRGQ